MRSRSQPLPQTGSCDGPPAAQNFAIVERIKALADKKGCLPGQLALAWVHAQARCCGKTHPFTRRR